jgi:hypothetical protein
MTSGMARGLLVSVFLFAAGCDSTTKTRPDGPFIAADGVTVWPHRVELRAVVCLDAGWLEQIACTPGTREHEALVVVEIPPSDLHAALLAAGLEPGSPGHWTDDGGVVTAVPPSGDRIRIEVRHQRDGRTVQESIRAWMIGAIHGEPFPESHWVFAGSAFADNPEWMGPGEHYVADLSGSVIGLVTFGDEVIGFETVMADQEAVEPMQWKVNTDHVPPIGTPVTIVLSRAEQ